MKPEGPNRTDHVGKGYPKPKDKKLGVYPHFIRPKVGTFNVATFGTCYASNGPYPGIVSYSSGVPVDYYDLRVDNDGKRETSCMYVFHNGATVFHNGKEADREGLLDKLYERPLFNEERGLWETFEQYKERELRR